MMRMWLVVGSFLTQRVQRDFYGLKTQRFTKILGCFLENKEKTAFFLEKAKAFN